MRGVSTTFPQVYADLDTKSLLTAYESGPRRLREALRDLSDASLRAEAQPGRWSIMNVALHLADSELVGAVRIRQVLGGDDPLMPAYDQDRWSVDLSYEEADDSCIARALDLFELLRATTFPLLRAATPQDWSRPGEHPEHGRITLRNLLELYADHSERHVEQIVERRRILGSPIELPPLLPRRLY
jgi:uncharacterized damage-inducible protein DinB